MLKHLFTSKARIKLLTIFLSHPEEEYFIRELTRRLNEQINSVRRELDNLRRLGLLRTRTKNRKKYFIVNKNFVLFSELRNIILKATTSFDQLVKKINRLGDVKLLILSGSFIGKETQADLLLVGDVPKDELEEILHKELEPKKPIRFTVMKQDDFLYRLKLNDRFIKELLDEPANIMAINKLQDVVGEGEESEKTESGK